MTNKGFPEKYNSHLRVAQDSINLLWEMFQLFMSKDIVIKENYRRVISVLAGRSLLTAKAIVILCENGYSEDSMCLIRSLFENAINVRYILLGNSLELGQRFVDYSNVDKYHTAQSRLHIKAIDGEFKDQIIAEIKTLEPKVKDFRKKYGTDNLKDWSGLNVEEMAKKCKLDIPYRLAWRKISSFTHGSVSSTTSYALVKEDHLLIKTIPDYSNLDDCLTYLVFFLHLTLTDYNSLYNLGMEIKLKNLLDSVSALESIE